jgi:hypothetical protein
VHLHDMPIVPISKLSIVSAYVVAHGLSVATWHPAMLARPESFERAGLMPRPAFRGRISERVSLVQAEMPRVPEAAEKYPQTAAALGALQAALRV